MADQSVLDATEDAVLYFSAITAVPCFDLFILHEDGLIAQQFRRCLAGGIVQSILLFRIRPTDSHAIALPVVRPLLLAVQFSLFPFEAVGFSNHDVVFRSVRTRDGGLHAHVQSDNSVLHRR